MALKPLLHRLSVVLFAALACVNANAQNSGLDTLLPQYRKGQLTPKLLNDLCWAYVFNQPDSAIYYGKQAAKLSQKKKDRSNEATAFNRMGVAFDVKHLPDSALLYYSNAVFLSEMAKEPSTTAGALNNIGLVYWNLGEHDKAVEHYIRAAEIFDGIGEKKGLANTYNNIGLILWEDSNFKEALTYSFKALDLRKQIGEKYGIGASYTNIGLIYGDLDKYDSAIYYLERSIPIKIEVKDDYGLAKSYHNLGSQFVKVKRMPEALAALQKALEISDRLGNFRSSASTLFYMGSVLRNQGDTEQAMARLSKAREILAPATDAKLYWKILYETALLHRDLGDHQKATSLLIRMDSMKDSVLNLEKSQAVEELELKYRTAVKDRQIEEQERTVAETSLIAERRNRYIIILISALIILALSALFYTQRTKRKAQAERDAAIIREREMGIRAVLTATEEERKRIAKDLHDGVVQGLTGLKLRIQNQLRNAALTPEQQAGFKETSSLLDGSIDELRTISHRMMPRALGELGLVPALADLLEKTFSPTNIRYEFEHHRVDDKRYPEHVEVSLYRIWQELINNIIKHAGASALSVQLLQTGSHLVLVVEDNGKGFAFEDAANRNGIGLMNISSRAKALNGEVTYAASPQQGTVATIRIPIA